MGANRSPESTYAKVVAKIKINNLGRLPPNPIEPTKSHNPPIHPISNVQAISPPTHPNTAVQSVNAAVSRVDSSSVKSPASVRPKHKILEDTSYSSRNKGHNNNKSDNPRKDTTPQGSSGKKASKSKQHKMLSVDSEGFWIVEGQKRARQTSPKSNDGLVTENIYSVLEEHSSPAKKKVVRESAEARSSGSTSRDHSRSPDRQMEVDNSKMLESREKTRIPHLDRKLYRSRSNSLTESPQSKGKAGNFKFRL